MPTGTVTASDQQVLLDTSAAVPLVLAAHEHHDAVKRAVAGRRLGLAGHAAFETYAVLTRLPGPDRIQPDAAHQLLQTNFPGTHHLSPERTSALWSNLVDLRVAGGSVYDALVGSAAAEAGLLLVTRDRRAIPVYRALQVRIEILA